MNKRLFFIFLLSFLLLVACASPEDEGDYYEDEPVAVEAEQSSDDSAESSDDELAECLDHESYDESTDSCYVEVSCETDDECEAIIDELYEGYDSSDLEYWDMLAEDCLPGEQYDAEEAICYISCDTDAECQQKAEEIYSGLDVYWYEDFSGGQSGRHGNESPEPAEQAEKSESDEPSTSESASTEQVDNALAQASNAFSVYSFDQNLDLTIVSEDDSADKKFLNRDRHYEIWRFVRTLLPKNVIRTEARQYQVFSDGPEETLAFVAQMPDDPDHWLIAIDIEDAGFSGELNQKEFVHTIVHEFAHILTLENNQVPPDASDAAYDGCNTYFPGEGCAAATSYINLYWQRFWKDIADEQGEIDQIEDENERYDATVAFYEKYQDRFVSDYAATNPGEDIAESFTSFVLKDKPTGDSIADKKVAFFYQFPPLVQIRAHIRGQLARAAQ